VTVKDGYALKLPPAPPQGPSGQCRQPQGVRSPTGRDRGAQPERPRNKPVSSGEKLDGTSYILIRQAGESGQLYGSVTGRDVSDAVNAEGGKIERSTVVLDKPIKTLGLHEVKVRLHAEVTITVTLNIAR